MSHHHHSCTATEEATAHDPHGDEAGHHPHSAHHHGPPLRAASSRALWSALVILAIFFVVELVGGVLTNSLALISDAVHLLTDVAAIGLALFAQWFGRSARQRHPQLRLPPRRDPRRARQRLHPGAVAIYITVEAYHRLHSPPTVRARP